jgi:hypothetical protein
MRGGTNVSDLREAAERVVYVHHHGKSKVRAKIIDDLKAALEKPDPHEDRSHRRGIVIEDVIRELEFEKSERWAPVIERLRGVL